LFNNVGNADVCVFESFLRSEPWCKRHFVGSPLP
jgi:hypothetical protein